MSPPPASLHPHPAEALPTFLRGVERRAWMLARGLAPDEAAADAALLAAMRALRGCHAGLPMARWPSRFWRELLAAPALRNGGLPPLPALEALVPAVADGRGLRAVLLLALFGGIDEAAAAEALGLPPQTHRDALARLWPGDVASAGALAEHPHAALQALPPDRLAHIARLREAVLAGQPAAVTPGPAPGRMEAREIARSPAPKRMLALVGVLTALALGATFLPWQRWREARIHPAIDARPLAAAAAPAQRYDAEFARLTDPDAALIAAVADDGDAAAWRDLEFQSWHAAQRAAERTRPTPAPLPEAAETVASATEADVPAQAAHAP